MWLNEADEFSEIFKGIFPFYLLIVLPLFIIISPINPVEASYEFPVYRMQQFDLHGVPHGCRSAPVNLEARSLTSWSTSRHCVVVRFQDLSAEHFREIRSKAGALLVVLPKDVENLPSSEKQVLMDLEKFMLSQEVFIPVYFASWTPEFQIILDDVATSMVTDEKAGTAAQALMNSVSANGYQIVVNTNKASPKSDVQIASVQGKLVGHGIEDKMPTIAIVAHYDSFGVAPEMSFGADSNASGVAMLLELARLFSHLYANAQTHARVNLLFLLSGGGKLNYQGSKKWLEDQLDGIDASLLQEANFILCLDTVGGGNSLYFHVSKPPRENSPGANFYKELKGVKSNVPVEVVHKKINLAEEMLAWEHERYSIRKLPAFTLSSLKTHKHPGRGTILDTRQSVDVANLVRNTEIVAQALARHIYNLTGGTFPFSKHMGVEADSLKMFLDFLTSQPRAALLLADKNNPLVTALSQTLGGYIKDVKISYQTADKRDPEFVFYDVTKAVVNVYSVKPAVFDLFLTFAIVMYLTVVYFFIQGFPTLYSIMLRFTSQKKSKAH
ncbi:BOS complex subunit ncln-like [Macrosteles quadrilineatus]|uniref:BOS complex subunit ncln-like n=1 Tax=Macrosteles quadrilineatus TaxID=74068 RepID=UPI0023E267B3|nr:BOS complex subunit ncln-like [Macrosteles quadrilineatus]